MTTGPTAKHREEAREIVTAHAEHSVVVRQEQLIDTFASALSSRDREIREVLEGLRSYTGCWCNHPDNHASHCLAARGLWERVQGTVSEEESDVDK